jgi:predicted RNA-binding protein with TRAM domain
MDGFGSLHLPTTLAIASLIFGGYPIFKSAIKTLLIPDLNVDTLVSIAAISATAVGAYREAATVIFIMLLGEFLEGLTVGKARKAIASLIQLTPKMAWIKREGKEVQVSIESVAFKGYGVARIHGKVAFIPYTVTGDRAWIEMTEEKEKYAMGRLTQITQPSSWRVDPLCTSFGSCGGCQWQHIDYAIHGRLKKEILEQILRRIGERNRLRRTRARLHTLEPACRSDRHLRRNQNQRRRRRNGNSRAVCSVTNSTFARSCSSMGVSKATQITSESYRDPAMSVLKRRRPSASPFRTNSSKSGSYRGG